MQTVNIMKPDFSGRAAEIMEEVRNSICIDDVDAEAIEVKLKYALKEYYDELDGYYDAGHSDGYVEGYDEGYDIGYDDGRSESYS